MSRGVVAAAARCYTAASEVGDAAEQLDGIDWLARWILRGVGSAEKRPSGQSAWLYADDVEADLARS